MNVKKETYTRIYHHSIANYHTSADCEVPTAGEDATSMNQSLKNLESRQCLLNRFYKRHLGLETRNGGRGRCAFTKWHHHYH